MRFSHYLWLLFASSPIFLTGCSSNDDHNHPQLISGQQFFEHHCAHCHDKTGQGTFLKGVPASIATKKTQTEIVLYLQEGPHTFKSKMPIFSSMPDKEAFKIAQYLLELKRSYYNDPNHRDKFLLKRQSPSSNK